jgi:AAA domain/Bifunctional DNA primase/polymerase, N-terminal/Primase C terminal 2 (PriCT-2)
MNISHIYSSSDFHRQVYLDEDGPIIEQLAEFRCQLLDNGYEPIPVKGKDGLNFGWSSGNIGLERVVEETLRGTVKLNTGIRCGRVAVVDNDLRDPQHAAALNEIVAHMLGPTPLTRRGSKGACLCYRNEKPIPKLTITTADGKTRLFEILGTGQQVVAYGKHPDGMDYAWIGDGEPATVPVSELPEVTPEKLRDLHATIREMLIELGYVLEKPEEPRTEKPASATKTYDNGDEDIPALCRAALEVIPNDLDREGWIKVCYAIRDAGLDFWDWQTFSEKWHGRHKRGAIEAAWDGCKNPRSVTFRTLLELADKADPEWRSRYYAPQREQRRREREQWIEEQYQDFRRQQEAEAEWDCGDEDIGIDQGKPNLFDVDTHSLEDDEQRSSANSASATQPELQTSLDPLVWDAGEEDDTQIPPREWLLGTMICRRYLTVVFAPGGAGKTTFIIGCGTAMATATPIFGPEMHVFQRCKVLYVSMEDDKNEVLRRIKACRVHHNISNDDLKGWFYVYNISRGNKLLSTNNKGILQQGKLADELTEIVKKLSIDVLVLDPFKKAHGVEENDNNAIDQVADILTSLAIEHNIAVVALHHVAKGRTEAGDPDVGRGASALKDAARLGYTLTAMTEREAEQTNIESTERWAYVRLDPAKANITARVADAKWFKLVSVGLENSTTLYPKGDHVQAIEQAEICDVMDYKNDKALARAVLGPIIRRPGYYTSDGKVKDQEAQIYSLFQAYDPSISIAQARTLVVWWIKEMILQKCTYAWMDEGSRKRERQGLKEGTWMRKVFEKQEIDQLARE